MEAEVLDELDTVTDVLQLENDNELDITAENGAVVSPVKESPAIVEPFVPPSEQLAKQLAEIYFSDDNIVKDSFLLKHVKKNKEGFVSLKLVASFRKIKKISKDWRHLAFAINKYSTQLELNPTESKVRRKAPIPFTDEKVYERSVLAMNMKLSDAANLDAVKGRFAAFGEVLHLRLLQPGQPVPDNLQAFARVHPEMTGQLCAMVEYASVESAFSAVNKLNDKGDWRGMKVLSLVKVKFFEQKAVKVQSRSERRSVSESEVYSQPVGLTSDENSRKFLQLRQGVVDKKFRDESSGSEASSPQPLRRFTANNRMLSKPRPVPQRANANKETPFSSPDVKWRHLDDSPLSTSPSSLSTSPWMQKRLNMNNSEAHLLVLGGKNAVTIVREPVGPDGTKGFKMARQSTTPSSN